jgi:hypothetical protein
MNTCTNDSSIATKYSLSHIKQHLSNPKRTRSIQHLLNHALDNIFKCTLTESSRTKLWQSAPSRRLSLTTPSATLRIYCNDLVQLFDAKDNLIPLLF